MGTKEVSLEKYRNDSQSITWAQVVAVAADADVALISVASLRFWRGMQPVEWGPLPQLRVGASLWV